MTAAKVSKPLNATSATISQNKQTMKHLLKTALLSTAALGIAACQHGIHELSPTGKAPSSTAELGSAHWRLTAGEHNGSPLTLNGTAITLQIVDGKITGNSGVNTYYAHIANHSGKLEIGNIMLTRMGGTSQAMRLESDYLSTLRETTSYERSGSTLTLKGSAGSLTYQLAP